ncbi:MAG: sulfatase-like hydrolase/transferase, partial [Planctomycetota bacterium]
QSPTEQPFFLYFALTAPHKPVLPHARFRGATELGDYGDFVAQVDSVVGQVVDAIAAIGAADDTLLMFTSDNGSFMYRSDDTAAADHVDDAAIQAYRADRHRSNGPLRGTKADIWEAGHRVPFFAVWPRRIAPTSSCEETICLTDVLATAAEIVAAPLGAHVAEDSYSFLPLLDGRNDQWNRPPVVHHSGSGMFAIRDAGWKLVAGNGSGGRERPKGTPFGEPYQLYDLAADLSETNDLSRHRADVVEQLSSKLDQIRSSGRSVSR